MDIHPEAEFGKGILMDHGTGIVVGQTARIGNNVSMLQNVTLGGDAQLDSLHITVPCRACDAAPRFDEQS